MVGGGLVEPEGKGEERGVQVTLVADVVNYSILSHSVVIITIIVTNHHHLVLITQSPNLLVLNQ